MTVSVSGKNINESSKQPGCDVNTRRGCYGGVRISHHCIQCAWGNHCCSDSCGCVWFEASDTDGSVLKRNV